MKNHNIDNYEGHWKFINTLRTKLFQPWATSLILKSHSFYHSEENQNKQKSNQKPQCVGRAKNMLEAMQIEFLTEKRR